MPGAITRFRALYSCISGMFVEQQLVLHIGEKQVSKSSRRAVTASIQTGDWKPSSCAYLSGWHQTLFHKHNIDIRFGLGIKDQQKDIGPEMFEEKLWLETMPPLAPHRLGEWAGYRTGCLKVRERGLPCTELQNVNLFTRSKTIKPNLNRRKVRISRQFWHQNGQSGYFWTTDDSVKL